MLNCVTLLPIILKIVYVLQEDWESITGNQTIHRSMKSSLNNGGQYLSGNHNIFRTIAILVVSGSSGPLRQVLD